MKNTCNTDSKTDFGSHTDYKYQTIVLQQDTIQACYCPS